MPAPRTLLGYDTAHISGADSFRDTRLPPGYYVRGWNIVQRGGVIQTRPGSTWMANLPDGKLQGATFFSPRRGLTSLVAVVDGAVYIAEYPFRQFRVVEGIDLNANADTIYFATAFQAVRRNDDNSLAFLDTPKTILMMQSGQAAPAYYDGYSAGQLTGVDVTPVGTAMAWSGGRLWVARDNKVFASDFANPFSFQEQFYLGESDAFSMPGNVTAMAEVAGLSELQLLVFTGTDTVSIQSGVMSRELWPATPNFIRTIFPGVGCVSHKSLCSQAGFLWWYAQNGLVNIDTARTAQVTTSFPTLDAAMGVEKRFMHSRRNAIAAVAAHDFVLVSVPYADVLNRHTWVLDNAAVRVGEQTVPPAWASVWTGFSPVQWATFVDEQQTRVFAICTTVDQKNSVHEFFTGDRQDSGQDIECGVELRALTADTPLLKKLQYVRFSDSELRGDVDIRVDWRGSRGPYKECLTRLFRASPGCFSPGQVIAADTELFGLKTQMRRFRSRQIDSVTDVALASTCRENRLAENLDWSFQFLVRWCGRLALREIMPVFAEEPNDQAGECDVDETDPVFSRFDGADADDLETLQDSAITTFIATETATGSANGSDAAAERSAESVVSQNAADRMARQAAESQVALTLTQVAEPTYGVHD